MWRSVLKKGFCLSIDPLFMTSSLSMFWVQLVIWMPLFNPRYADESHCRWDIDSVQCRGYWWETSCNWKTCAAVSCRSHKCIYRVQIVLKKSIAGSGNNFHIVSNDLWWAHSPCRWRKKYFENSAAGDHQRWPAHGFLFSSRLAGSSARNPFSRRTMLPPKAMMVWWLATRRWQQRLLCRNVYFSKLGAHETINHCCFETWQIGELIKLVVWHACQTRPNELENQWCCFSQYGSLQA